MPSNSVRISFDCHITLPTIKWRRLIVILAAISALPIIFYGRSFMAKTEQKAPQAEPEQELNNDENSTAYFSDCERYVMAKAKKLTADYRRCLADQLREGDSETWMRVQAAIDKCFLGRQEYSKNSEVHREISKEFEVHQDISKEFEVRQDISKGFEVRQVGESMHRRYPESDILVVSMVLNSTFIPFRGVFLDGKSPIQQLFVHMVSPYCVKKYLAWKICEDNID